MTKFLLEATEASRLDGNKINTSDMQNKQAFDKGKCYSDVAILFR
jgi:hypothetical protein